MKTFWTVFLILLLVGMIVMVAIVTQMHINERKEVHHDSLSPSHISETEEQNNDKPPVWCKKEGVLVVNGITIPDVTVTWYYDNEPHTVPWGEIVYWQYVVVPVLATLEQFGMQHTPIDETHIVVFRSDDPEGKQYILDLDEQTLCEDGDDIFSWMSREPIGDWMPWLECPYPLQYVKDGDLYIDLSTFISGIMGLETGFRYSGDDYETGMCYFDRFE